MVEFRRARKAGERNGNRLNKQKKKRKKEILRHKPVVRKDAGEECKGKKERLLMIYFQNEILYSPVLRRDFRAKRRRVCVCMHV